MATVAHRSSYQAKQAEKRLKRAVAVELHRNAILSVPPEQRKDITVEDNGVGVAARKGPMPLDRMFVRYQLSKDEDVNAARYTSGKELEGLWEFVEAAKPVSVSWDGLSSGQSQAPSCNGVDRRVNATLMLEGVREACGEHWPVLERVVCLGKPVERRGRDSNRLDELKDALDFLREKKLISRY